MNKKKLSSYILPMILVTFGVVFFLFYIQSLWNQFESLCVNKDFLTWDPELRFIITLKMMDHIRNGKLLSYLSIVFDSPHWPSLRNVFESLVFFLTGPSPKATIAITFLFYCLLPFGFLYTLSKEKFPPFFVGLFFLLSVFGILQAESLQLYAFTGMIELQGAFIFLITAYLISRVYTEPIYPENTSLGWRVLIATTLLYHSKYPYGYMLVLCLFFIEVFFSPKNTFTYGFKYLKERKNEWYKNIRLWIFLLLFLALFLPSSVLIGKIPNYLRYGIVLILVIDFFLFFYREENQPDNARIHFHLKWIIFPILLWMFSQPDRFGSYSGQITHVEAQGFNPGEAIVKDLDYYLLFINEFLLSSFQGFLISYVLFFGNLSIVLYGVYNYIRTKTFEKSFILALLCMITFLELSLFTTNRLARHTYHLFPALFLSLFFFLGEKWIEFPKATIVFTSILTIVFLNPFLERPLNLTSKVELCYAGYDPGDYFSPRWIEEKASEILKKPTIVLNEMSPYHVNKADVEYLVFKMAYERKLPIQFDPKRWKKIDLKWEELWIIGNECSSIQKYTDKKELWEQSGFLIQNAYKFESDLGCIQVLPRIEEN
jgi:hypothetical protein